MKFNTQVCTTREQSERLLALGLKKETADMYLTRCFVGNNGTPMVFVGTTYKPSTVLFSKEDIPAWSLGRLIAIGESSLTINSNGRTVVANDYSCFDNHENLFDNIIDWLDWLNKRNVLYES